MSTLGKPLYALSTLQYSFTKYLNEDIANILLKNLLRRSTLGASSALDARDALSTSDAALVDHLYVWIVDSACNVHIVNQINYLHNPRLLPTKLPVKVASNHVLYMTHIGTAYVLGARGLIELTGVLYCKHITHCLFSPHILTESYNDADLNFNRKFVTIRRRQDDLAKGVKFNSLWYLFGVSPSLIKREQKMIDTHVVSLPNSPIAYLSNRIDSLFALDVQTVEDRLEWHESLFDADHIRHRSEQIVANSDHMIESQPNIKIVEDLTQQRMMSDLHHILGHLSWHTLDKFTRRGVKFHNFPSSLVHNFYLSLKRRPHYSPSPVCDTCARAKATRRPFTSARREITATRPGECIDADLCGPIKIKSLPEGLDRDPNVKREAYILVLLDRYSRYLHVEVLNKKSEATTAIISFIKKVKTRHGNSPREFRCDGGGEFVNNELKEFFNAEGIHLNQTPPYTPQHNAKVERANRYLMDMVRALLLHANLHQGFWIYALYLAVYILNRRIHLHEGRLCSPLELWTEGKEIPDLKAFHGFGCDCYVTTHMHNGKLGQRGQKGIYLGRHDGVSHKVLLIDDSKVVNTRDVKFTENTFTFARDRFAVISETLDAELYQHVINSELRYQRMLLQMYEEKLSGQNNLQISNDERPGQAPSSLPIGKCSVNNKSNVRSKPNTGSHMSTPPVDQQTPTEAHRRGRSADVSPTAHMNNNVTNHARTSKNHPKDTPYSNEQKETLNQSIRNKNIRHGGVPESSAPSANHAMTRKSASSRSQINLPAHSSPSVDSSQQLRRSTRVSIPPHRLGGDNRDYGPESLKEILELDTKDAEQRIADGLCSLLTITHSPDNLSINIDMKNGTNLFAFSVESCDTLSDSLSILKCLFTETFALEGEDMFGPLERISLSSVKLPDNRSSILQALNTLARKGINVIEDPQSYEEALNSPYANGWKEAIDKEMKSLIKHLVFVLVERPVGVNVVKAKWVFKTKLKSNGLIDKLKARVVAKGFSQMQGIDYFETYSPVMSYKAMRVLLVIACSLDWNCVQLDIVTAFLYGDLDETIYMEIPEG
ncbi:MAG: reverse transcriptase domain-containing protein, partial [Exiguobacterium sp.]